MKENSKPVIQGTVFSLPECNIPEVLPPHFVTSSITKSFILAVNEIYLNQPLGGQGNERFFPLVSEYSYFALRSQVPVTQLIYFSHVVGETDSEDVPRVSPMLRGTPSTRESATELLSHTLPSTPAQ